MHGYHACFRSCFTCSCQSLICPFVAVAGSYCVQYCDAVLKSLPDIKTVISLRQQLLGGATPASMSTDSMALTPDEVHRNAGM